MSNGSLSKALLNLDQFRVVSRDLTRGSITGGACTVIAYAALVLLLVAELGAFLRTSYQTNIMMDQNENELMPINFDVLMYDLPCKYLKLTVWDKFGVEKVQTRENFRYMPVDHIGQSRGMAYTPEEIQVLEKVDEKDDISDEERANLDSDWASSSDHFKHTDFHAAVTLHDFTIVNFFAEWCIHCRKFHPMWEEAAKKIGEKMTFNDATGGQATVKFLKMNCVDFSETCKEFNIAAFPTIRLYKRDGTFEAFAMKRSIDNIISFLTSTIRNSHLITAHHHSMFNEGCQVEGTLHVPRVPGHFHLQAEPFGDLSLNPALTNVSHFVNHLSFGEKNAKQFAERSRIPREMLTHVTPLDGKKFIVQHFHEAPQHYLKVVSTHVAGKKDVFYQMTHTDRTRRLKKENQQQAPQARFSYDFSPMSVVVKPKNKRWYEFLTSLFAILGGTYTICELCSGAVDTAQAAIKDALGKGS